MVDLDTGYADALADGAAESIAVGETVENTGRWPYEVQAMEKYGSDKFRRNFTRINHFRLYMNKLGIEITEGAFIMDGIAIGSQLIYGAILMQAGLVTAYRTMKQWMDAEAAAQTAAMAWWPPFWATIALAAFTAAGVYFAFQFGRLAARGFRSETVYIRSRWTTPGGRANVVATLQENAPEGD